MYTIQPKKMLIIDILDILKRYSDENHRLSQKDFVEILEKEYMMKADRKSVKRNLMNLIDFGFNLEYTETVRTNAKGEEETIYTEWYLVQEFSDAELRLIIDSLLFSKHLNGKNCAQLIGKLEGLSNVYFKSRCSSVLSLSNTGISSQELFYNIEVLDEAIAGRKQVAFHYEEYGKDLKLHHRCETDGTPREYLINPYQMVAANNRYYLICNLNKYDNVSYYRVDWIKDIRILESIQKPMGEVRGLENGLDLPGHMAEHVYMFTGEGVSVTFKADKAVWNQVVDWFRNLTVLEEDESTYTVRTKVNERAMYHWILQYGEYVEVLKPERLRTEIVQTVEKMYEKYGGKQHGRM